LASLDMPTQPFASAWAPFHHRWFSTIWIATVISGIGGWMSSAASGWLMTSLRPDPVMVALVQAASTFPMFLLAIPAGALADIIDKRRLLLFGELSITIIATVFAAIVWLDLATPLNLLLFTLLTGTAVALTWPAWLAVVPQLVPKADLSAAITADSMGMNVSRAVGPALGGAIAGALGLSAPFWVNGFSNLGVVAALLAWRPRKGVKSTLPVERLGSAIRTGVRYARHSPPLRATLVRAVAFFVFGSAYWALLPLITHSQIGGGPSLYGALLGTIGGSAVAGAMLMPQLESKIGRNGVVIASTIGTAVALVLFGLANDWLLATAASIIAGVCWIGAVASLNVSAQVALPDWVRGRGIAIYMSVFFGALTAGSALWGGVADVLGLSMANFVAAAGLLIGIPATCRWQLPSGKQLDLTPSMHWPAPILNPSLAESRGRVLVLMEYRVSADHRAPFLAAVQNLGEERRRDGAYAWGIFEDVAEDDRFVETFLVESWLEYLRQHERATRRGRALDQAVKAFSSPGDPVVSHLISADGNGILPTRHKRAWRDLIFRKKSIRPDA
jgi:MFS family permease